MRRWFDMDDHNYEPDWPIFRRDSARIVLYDEKGRLAMIHSLKYGEYKFPGGGIEEGEAVEGAAMRECAEETGLVVDRESLKPLGDVLVQRAGQKGREIFVQHNYYFLGKWNGQIVPRNLSAAEEERQFTFVWVEPETALKVNKKLLEKGPWTRRETKVLERLIQMRGEKASEIQGFAPVWDKNIERLVIGSMPSVISLKKHEYFGNPRNAFWPIAYASFDMPLEADYEKRLRFLLDRGIGLWDAAAGCERKGSMDANMRNIRLNDFARLLADCPRLHTVLCNGKKAYELFMKTPEAKSGRVHAVCLPSTSPALAALSFSQKLEIWKPYLKGEI